MNADDNGGTISRYGGGYGKPNMAMGRNPEIVTPDDNSTSTIHKTCLDAVPTNSGGITQRKWVYRKGVIKMGLG